MRSGAVKVRQVPPELTMGKLLLGFVNPCERIVHCFKRRFGTSKDWRSGNLRLSYWHNPGTEPLVSMTVGQLVDKVANQWGDREALVSVHQGHRLSFSQIRDQVEKLAAGFIELGLQQGDRVGLWGPNSSQWYLTNLAAARAGLVLVNINPAYQVPELHYCLTKVGVKALVAADVFKTQNYHQMVQSLAPELATCRPGELKSEKLPDLTSLIIIGEHQLPGAFQFSDVMEAGSSTSRERVKQIQEEIQPDDGCNVQFTSGTTGQPKGTLLSHHNIVNNSYSMGKYIGLNLKHHRICLQVPLFHAFGNVLGVLCALHHGSTLVLPAPNFQPRESVLAIQQENCTIVYGTPTMHIDILTTAQDLQAALPSLQVALSAGSPISPHLVQKLKKALQLERVTGLYGMTETSPGSFAMTPADTEEEKAITVGSVVEHVEVKVVDNSGKIVPMGVPGELWVRGYLTMLGYWGDEEKTREVMGPDRWLRTGDQFVLREDGYGQVVGRIKDMIIRGGENIFPKEIEEFLQLHPDVIEAQVFGVPDERLGEEIYACIRLKPETKLMPDDFKSYCKGKIAHFKIPKHIQFVTEFPKTASGKIQKFKLQEMVQKK